MHTEAGSEQENWVHIQLLDDSTGLGIPDFERFGMLSVNLYIRNSDFD